MAMVRTPRILGTDTGTYRTLAQMTGGGSRSRGATTRATSRSSTARRFQVYDRVTGDTIDFGDDVPLVANFASRP